MSGLCKYVRGRQSSLAKLGTYIGKCLQFLYSYIAIAYINSGGLHDLLITIP